MTDLTLVRTSPGACARIETFARGASEDFKRIIEIARSLIRAINLKAKVEVTNPRRAIVIALHFPPSGPSEVPYFPLIFFLYLAQEADIGRWTARIYAHDGNDTGSSKKESKRQRDGTGGKRAWIK